MKPGAFTYVAAESLDAALTAKAQYGDDARFLAGGQSLIPAMNFRVLQSALLVDLNRLASLDSIRQVDGELRIGAMTRQRRIERDPLVAQLAPLLPLVYAKVTSNPSTVIDAVRPRKRSMSERWSGGKVCMSSIRP